MSDKNLLVSVSPSKPVAQMSDDELNELVDQIWEVAARKLDARTQTTD